MCFRNELKQYTRRSPSLIHTKVIGCLSAKLQDDIKDVYGTSVHDWMGQPTSGLRGAHHWVQESFSDALEAFQA